MPAPSTISTLISRYTHLNRAGANTVRRAVAPKTPTVFSANDLHRKHEHQVRLPPTYSPVDFQLTSQSQKIELDIEPDYKVHPHPAPFHPSIPPHLLTAASQVSRIKERVEEKEGIPPVQQRLIFGGKQMYVLCAGFFC
ncbi:MAG: hypothetical protein L6R40_001430 [Gallowayella cf. fulva]|nr:MAG: hypothetical protein L6R40_001430 [Xanthomendoza cf. fulva]